MTRKILIVAFVLYFISLIFIILSSFALSDIFHDYVSKNVLFIANINIEKFPQWTQCKNEWMILQLDFLIRAISLMVFTIILIKMLKISKNKF